ncbi:MAG: pyridoxamine 5'-phosphate oxidase family protein [Nakamurella sp.]
MEQGSLELLEDPIAVRLLGSAELARLAYNAQDGTPRVIPMMFHWTGEEVIFGTYAGSAKLRSLRANPDVAITIDTPGPPPDVLLLRGRAELGGVGGIVSEYAAAHRRYYGDEQGTSNVGKMAADGIRMVRIAVRPTWVGVLDFQTRVPGRLS